MRKLVLPLFLLTTMALGGCAASIAAGALGAAARAAEAGRAPVGPQSARDACVAEASRHGQAKIIDVEQRSASKIVVWGTVENEQQRRSFQCSYTGKISNFELRRIRLQ